jgi:hypothetical protein
MTITDFKRTPWQTSHPKYKSSALAVSPAPEYASSEVLVASLYRTIGFESKKESSVPQAGRDLERKLKRLRDKGSPPPKDSTVDVETWNTTLHGVLESPKLPNQSTKRFLQVTPLVPSLACFSGSARLASNSWPAGSLVKRMIWLGSKDHIAALILWKDLFASLTVGENDDIFARWLEQETAAWDEPSTWKLANTSELEIANLDVEDYDAIKFLPARQFTKDLRSVLQAKEVMTRRQWTSLLEAVIRIASVAHVNWLCDVQTRLWRCISETLMGQGPLEIAEVRAAIFPESPQYMTYGGKALNGIRDRASGYLASRLGINALLWSLDEIGAQFDGDVSSTKGVAKLCVLIRANQESLKSAGTLATLADLREREARALNCKKGIGVNLMEFARHVLGQRQTSISLLRGYDQGYLLKKKGNHSSSPWIVSLGPVAVLALVHCSLAGMGGPRSIHRLGQHLAAYGIAVDRHDIARNDLGQQLRMLGLVLDSPDAESGMLLLPPFPFNEV